MLARYIGVKNQLGQQLLPHVLINPLEIPTNQSREQGRAGWVRRLCGEKLGEQGLGRSQGKGRTLRGHRRASLEGKKDWKLVQDPCGVNHWWIIILSVPKGICQAGSLSPMFFMVVWWMLLSRLEWGKEHEKIRTKTGDVQFPASLLWRQQLVQSDCPWGGQFCRSEQTAWSVSRNNLPCSLSYST